MIATIGKLLTKINALLGGAQAPLLLLGRIMLAFIFFDSGLERLTGGYTASEHYMQGFGVPVVFLPFATALEFFGGLCLGLGLLARLAAAALAVFAVTAAFLFFPDLSLDTQWVGFLNNIAVAGGLLLIVGFGPGKWSVDHRLNLES